MRQGLEGLVRAEYEEAPYVQRPRFWALAIRSRPRACAVCEEP